MGQSRADIAARGDVGEEGSSPLRPHSLPTFSATIGVSTMGMPYRSHGWRNGCRFGALDNMQVLATGPA